MKNLLEQAEVARQAGKREEYLRLKKQAEKEAYDLLQAAHAEKVKAIKAEYPIGSYIEGVGHVEKIEDGCGTGRGWVHVTISGKKYDHPADIRYAIAKKKERARILIAYGALKDTKMAHGSIVLPGTGEEALDNLLRYIEIKNIWTLEEWSTNNIDSFLDVRSYAEEQAKADGYTDEEAEQKGMDAEGEANSEAYAEYKGKIEKVLERALEYAGLELLEHEGGYRIAPAETWKASADKIVEVINGVGMFEYADGKALKEAGPYATYCRAVIGHLHWLKHGPEVYGDSRFESIFR